jgi:hypothetical protein
MLLLFIACSEPEPVEEPVYDGVTGGEPAEGDVELVLSGESAPAGTASAVLYGYDANVADAVATPIEGWEWPVEGLPHGEVLHVPEDPHTLIDQGHGAVAEEDARFYFGRVELETEDGVWTQDFDATGITFFAYPFPEQVQVTVTAAPAG